MKQDIFISVVTPVYNGQNYILDYIKSLNEQTYRNFEIIIIDDGSSDCSKPILERFIEQYNLNIRLFSQENRGISYSIYRGIQEAHSNYIVLMDQDDMAHCNRLEIIANKFASGNELIMSAYDIVDNEGNYLKKTVRFPIFINDTNVLQESLKRNYFLGSAMAFKYKNDFEFDLQSDGVTDYDIALKMLFNSYKFCYINKPLLLYRVHKNNVSANYNKIKESSLYILSKYKEKFLMEYLRKNGSREADINTTIGVLSLYKGNNDLALKFLLKAESNISTVNKYVQLEIFFYLSVCYYLNGNLEQTFKYLLLCLNIEINPSVANNIGVIYSHKKDYSAARYWFEKAITLNSDYVDACRNFDSIKIESEYKYIFTERLLRYTLNHSRENIKL